MTAIEFQYSLIGLEKNLLRFAYGLTDNKNDAQDLVQETFLKALLHCNKFDGETNLRAWTFTILKNTFINNYRRIVFQNTSNNQLLEKYCLHYAQTSDADIPDSVYSSKELEKTIEALDENFRLPFKMHYEGYKYKEIAETLNLYVGTVKSRIFFARKKIMTQLNEH
jgi:RNA polymerase sigma-70 factor (ECF subfamily)